MFRKITLASIDWIAFLCIVTLTVIGFINCYSASNSLNANFYVKQLIWFSAGYMLLLTLLFFNYKSIVNLSVYLQIFIISLLIIVLIFGKVSGGSQRWLNLGFFYLQPSEFAKLGSIILFSSFFATNEKPSYHIWELWKPLLLLGITFLLIFKQPDFGTAGIILLICGTMILIAGLRWTSIIGLIACGVLLLPVLWGQLKPYQKNRIFTFLDPSRDPLGLSYHTNQAKIAVGSGKIWGKGFLQGTQTQLAFLPEAHTDFAFSIWAEEWGFVGCIFLIGAFVILITRIVTIALGTSDRFGRFLAIGIASSLFWHVVINISMNIGLFPVVGVPLPLISYGGSSVITTFLGFGLLFSIHARRSLEPPRGTL